MLHKFKFLIADIPADLSSDRILDKDDVNRKPATNSGLNYFIVALNLRPKYADLFISI